MLFLSFVLVAPLAQAATPIIVYNPPSSNFTYGESVTFGPAGSSGPTYTWNWGDGSANYVSTSPFPRAHRFPAAGTYTVTLTTSNGGAGLDGASTKSVTITRRPLTITANSASRPYGQANPAFTTSYSGFASGDSASKLTTPPTLSTTATDASPPGTYPITASGAASGNYTFSYASGTLTISQASQTITFNDYQTMVFGQTLALTATASSGLPVSYTSATPDVCVVDAGVLSTLRAGAMCDIDADQPGDAGYQPAQTVRVSFPVSPEVQAITGLASDPLAPAFTPGGTFAVSATGGASGNPVVFATTSPLLCSVSGNTVTMLSAGTCSLTADQAGNHGYHAAAQATLDVVIGTGTQAISAFVANPAAPVFIANGTFNVAATGGGSGNPVVFASTTTSTCTVNGNTVAMLAAGTCALTANQAGDASYGAAPQATLDVVIAQATSTLAWRGDLQKTVGESAFDLPAPTGNSTGGFTFTSSNPAVATVSGRAVTVVGAGVTTLVATQAAAGSYRQGSVSLTLTVSARPDPTRDPGVAGGLQAQTDASVRFAVAQQQNIQGRLRQLRSVQGNPSSNTLSVAHAAGPALPLEVQGNAANGQRPAPTGWGVWTAGVITVGSREGRGDDFDFRSDGVTFGADRQVGAHGLLGVAAGFGWDDADFDEARSNLDADQKSLSVYGLWRGSEHLFVDGVLGHGRLSFDVHRWSQVAGATADARRDGEQTFGALTFGYQDRGERMDLAGYGRVDASRTTLDAYRESGLGIHDLAYRGQTVENSAVAVGLEGSHPFKTTAGMVRPHWLLEYRDALRNSSDAAINYVVQPVSNDYLLGLRSYRESGWTIGAGLDMALTSGWQFSLLLQREQAAGTGDSNSVGLRVSYGATAP